MMLVTIGNRVIFDIRQQLYRHLQRLSMRYFETHSTGRIMTRILYDVSAVQRTLTGNLVDIITNSLTVIFVIVLLFAINREVLRDALSVLNVEVTLAESGEQAIEILDRQDFDIVVCHV